MFIDDAAHALSLAEGYEKAGQLSRAATYLVRIRDEFGDVRLGGDAPEGPRDDEKKPDERKPAEGEGSGKGADGSDDAKTPDDGKEPEEGTGAKEGKGPGDDPPPGDEGGERPKGTSGVEYFESKTKDGRYAAYVAATGAPATGVAAGPRLTEAWKIEDAVLSGARLIGAVPVADGETWFIVQTPRGDASHGLQCRKASDGTLVWSAPFLALQEETRNKSVYADFLTNPDVRLGPPTPTAHRIGNSIVVCLEKDVHAFHLTGGKLQWSIEIPTPDHDALFAQATDVSDYDKRLVQQRINTLKWDRVYFPNVAVGDLLVVFSPKGELVAYHTGRVEIDEKQVPRPHVAWRVEATPSRWNELLADGDRVVLVQRVPGEKDKTKTRVLVVDALSGTEVGRFERDGGIRGRGVEISAAGILAFVADGELVGYDVRHGAWAWTRRAPGGSKFLGMVPLGTRWIGAYRKTGEFLLVDASTGESRWTVPLGAQVESILAAAGTDDRVYLAVGDQQPLHNPLASTYMWNRTYQEARILAYGTDSPKQTASRLVAQNGRIITLAWMDILPVEGGLVAFTASYQPTSNWVGVFDAALAPLNEVGNEGSRQRTSFVNDPRRAILAGQHVILESGAGLVAWRSGR